MLQRLVVRSGPRGGQPYGCSRRLARSPPLSPQNELFSLPVAAEQGLVLGRVVELPHPSTRLPREKPLPKPKAPTKWEAYAKSKGIVKRKRSARVWDEEQGEWRGRHGYRRVGDPDDKPILDAKSWETTGGEDPFSKAASEKKSRVSAQAWRQAANQGRAAAAGGGGMPGLSARGAPLGVIKSAAIARQSTASKGAHRSVPSFLPFLFRRRGGRSAAQSACPHALRGYPARLWLPPLPGACCGAPPSMGAHLRVNAETSSGAVAGLGLPRSNAHSFALMTCRRRSDFWDRPCD